MLPFSCTRAASSSTSFKRRAKKCMPCSKDVHLICCTELEMASEGTGVPPRFVPSVETSWRRIASLSLLPPLNWGRGSRLRGTTRSGAFGPGRQGQAGHPWISQRMTLCYVPWYSSCYVMVGAPGKGRSCFPPDLSFGNVEPRGHEDEGVTIVNTSTRYLADPYAQLPCPNPHLYVPYLRCTSL